MKKVLIGVLALVMILGLVGCSSSTPSEETNTAKPTETTPVETESQTPEPTQEATINPFVLDGAYYCLTGIQDPSKYGLTVEEYLEKNPQMKEENLKDNDEITIFVFASLNSLEDGKEDLTIPLSMLDSFIGKYLNLRLTINGYEYKTGYELNNTDNKFSQHWDKYKDGKTLDTNDILYAGGGESKHIASYFSVRYHDYKEAIEKNAEITLNWADTYTITFNASEIEKEESLTTISQRLKEKGLID